MPTKFAVLCSTLKVLKPKMSNFTISSATQFISYPVIFCPSEFIETGQTSDIGLCEIAIPEGCTPVFLLRF